MQVIKVGAPNSDPQKQFMKSEARYTAYGGARGGGKTWAVRAKAVLLAAHYGGIRILVLRRTFPQLRQNFIMELRSQLAGIAKYREGDKMFAFDNGSTITLGYCDRESDVDQYQGQEYDIIIMDEATHFTEYQFTTLTACNRGTNNFPKRFYLTCNPGGVGHGWVKRLFIDRKHKETENPDDYVFIPAKVTDNVDLMENSPDYVNNLKNLPDDLREAWLNGNWDIFVGQYFSEWRKEVHVVEPFAIPAHWRKFYALDYGLDMLAGYLIAMDEYDKAYVVSEIFEGRDNGQGPSRNGLTVSEAAERILATTTGHNVEVYYGPPDLWNRRQETGRSAAEIFADYGICLVKGINNRVQGWLDVKEWLRPYKDGSGARLQVFKNCTNLIESIPMLVYSENDPNDCAREPHIYTHGPDAIRYFIAGRPYAADPVTDEEEVFDEYEEGLSTFLNYGA